MSSQTSRPQNSLSPDEIQVRALYRQMLDRWNQRSADKLAALFDEDGNLVGFDGSPLNGRAEIESQIRQIFADHPTAAYVGKIRAANPPDGA